MSQIHQGLITRAYGLTIDHLIGRITGRQCNLRLVQAMQYLGAKHFGQSFVAEQILCFLLSPQASPNAHAGGGQNRDMSQNLLYFQQVNTCFN